jgi:hypothetical protein
MWGRLEKTRGYVLPPTLNQDGNLFLQSLPAKVRNVLLNKGIGIEVEIENVPRKYVFNSWNQIGDGSLRNNGAEFVTKYGARIHHLPEVFNELLHIITETRKKNPDLFQFSERCSVHIHLDVREFTEEHLTNLICLYLLFEKSFYHLTGADRYHNIFCTPLLETGFFMGNSTLHNVKSAHKYSALNLAPVSTLGTVEFRAMEGTLDLNKLFAWIFILASMVSHARFMESANLHKTILELKTTSLYRNFAEGIFYNLIQYLDINETVTDSAASDVKLFLGQN